MAWVAPSGWHGSSTTGRTRARHRHAERPQSRHPSLHVVLLQAKLAEVKSSRVAVTAHRQNNPKSTPAERSPTGRPQVADLLRGELDRGALHEPAPSRSARRRKRGVGAKARPRRRKGAAVAANAEPDVKPGFAVPLLASPTAASPVSSVGAQRLARVVSTKRAPRPPRPAARVGAARRARHVGAAQRDHREERRADVIARHPGDAEVERGRRRRGRRGSPSRRGRSRSSGARARRRRRERRRGGGSSTWRGSRASPAPRPRGRRQGHLEQAGAQQLHRAEREGRVGARVPCPSLSTSRRTVLPVTRSAIHTSTPRSEGTARIAAMAPALRADASSAAREAGASPGSTSTAREAQRLQLGDEAQAEAIAGGAEDGDGRRAPVAVAASPRAWRHGGDDARARELRPRRSRSRRGAGSSHGAARRAPASRRPRASRPGTRRGSAPRRDARRPRRPACPRPRRGARSASAANAPPGCSLR